MKLYKVKRAVSTVFIYLDLVLVAVAIIYPLLWVFGSSINASAGIARSSVIPERVTLEHYINLFTETDYGKWYLNTLYVALLTTFFAIIFHTMTAFIFARFKFKGRKLGLLAVMILQMFPTFMGLTALYMVALNFNMLNNLNMLVIIYVAGGIPGNIWLVRGYMLNIPRSMDEAASIDGVTKFQLFYKIILPLSVPIIFFITVTTFIGPWMDFMLPRYLINRSELRTLAVGLFDFVNTVPVNIPAFCAGAVLVAVPITAIYIAFQRFLVEGLMAGANKGE